MRILRTGGAILVAAAGILAGWYWVWLPYQCSTAIRLAREQVRLAYDQPDSLRGMRTVRQLIDVLDSCLRRNPPNIEGLMVKGAALGLLRRHEEAVTTYQRALRFDRRPEIYLNIGRMYLAIGRLEEAYQAFLVAAGFNPDFVQAVPHAGLQDRLRRHLGSTRAGPANLLRNPSFSIHHPFHLGPTSFTGRGPGGFSSAAGWRVWNDRTGTTTTRLVAGADRGHESRIRVTTSAEASGLTQTFRRADTGVERLVTSAWVFVIRGRVAIGSGKGGLIEARGVAGGEDLAISSTRGQWELLTVETANCRADTTAILAAHPEGADFLVSRVQVRRLPIPCEPRNAPE